MLFRKGDTERFTATETEAKAFEQAAFGRDFSKGAVPADNAGTRPAVITGNQLERSRRQPTGKPTKKVSAQTVLQLNNATFNMQDGTVIKGSATAEGNLVEQIAPGRDDK